MKPTPFLAVAFFLNVNRAVMKKFAMKLKT